MGRKAKTGATMSGKTELTNLNEVSIAKLQLDAIESANKFLAQLNQMPEAFENIKEQVENAKSKLGYDLKAKEIEVEEAIANLYSKLENQKISVAEEIESLKDQYEDAKLLNDRDLEKLMYDHVIAIRDKNKATADTIAKSLKMELIETERLNKLLSEEMTPEKIQALEAAAKKSAEDSLNKSFVFEKREIKSQYDLQIQLLSKELEMTKASLADTKATILKQETMISKHGEDIQNALSAAKVNFNMPMSDSNRK